MSDFYLVIEPSGDMRWERIDHSNLLDRLHQIIGCRCIEQVNSILDGISLIVDDSGKIKSPAKAFNRTASPLYAGYIIGDDSIVGTVVLASVRVDPESPYHEHDLFGLDIFDYLLLRQSGFKVPPRPRRWPYV